MTIPEKTRGTKRGRVRHDSGPGPFAIAALWYSDQGYAPLPISRKTKSLLVRGITGREGKDLTEDQIQDMAAGRYGAENIALRCPVGVCGLDVDAYSGPGALATLRAAERRLGPLPPTVTSTSRRPADRVSGIRLYRVPPGRELRSEIRDADQPTAGQVVQWHHRYVVCAPSVHPDTGRAYFWYRGADDEPVTLPPPDEIPRLPKSWLAWLSSPLRMGRVVAQPASAEQSGEWWESVARGRKCDAMAQAEEADTQKLRAAARDGGAHDAMTAATWHLIHYAAEGHQGLGAALIGVRLAFMASGRRRSLAGEWDRAVTAAIAHAAALPQERTDPCNDLRGFRAPRSR